MMMYWHLHGRLPSANWDSSRHIVQASGTVAPVSVSKGAGLDVYPPEVAYYSKEGDVQVLLHATAGAAANSLARHIVEASEAAIKAKGSFTLVLSGGSLLKSLAALLSYKGTIQWDKVSHTHAETSSCTSCCGIPSSSLSSATT